MNQCLKINLNGYLKEESWQQSSLPTKWGGLGIRMATDLCLPAFISSAHGATSGMRTFMPNYQTDQYQDLQDAESEWATVLLNNAVQPVAKSVQALWDAPIFEKKYNDILNNQTIPAERARLRAVASEHASNWLNALPVPALGLKLDNTSLRMAVGLRLGYALCQPHKCICGSLVDSTGRHGLSCKNAKGTAPRHNQVNDILREHLWLLRCLPSKSPEG